MFEIKQLTKFVILIDILFIGFLLGILVNFNVNAISEYDLTYTFENDVLFEQDDTEFYTDFNTRQYETWEHDGIFNATYSFDEQPIGTNGSNINFIDDDSSGSNSGASIISSLNGHKNVLQLFDKDASEQFNITHNFDKVQINGIIEFWCAMTKTGAVQVLVEFIQGSTKIIEFLFQSDDLYYDSTGVGGWVFIKQDFILLGVFNHYKIILDDDANSFDIYINNILEGNDLSYGNPSTIGIDKFRMWSYISNPELSFYIDAFGIVDSIYIGEHFDVGAQDNSPRGITWDGESFWVIGSINKYVYKYYVNGTYTGFNFDVSSQDTIPRGITWDGESFWVVGISNKYVYKYYANGTYTGISFDVGAQDDNPEGIIWDSEYFWLIGDFNKEVYKYHANGSYSGASFYVGTQDNSPKGITWDGESFWITGITNDKVYKYYANGTYTGFSFDVGIQDNIPIGITWNNTHFFILGAENNEIYSYKLIYYKDYEIGDNLYDTLYLDNFGTEVDKWEFTFKELFERFDDGDDNPNGWTDLEDGGDDVNCKRYWDENYNMYNGIVELYANSGEQLGLYKDNLGYSEDIELNVSFGFEIKYIYSILNNDVYLEVYSSDNTEIVRIRINNDGSLKYWVSGTTYTQLTTGFVIDTNYDINLEINYISDKCTLRYTTDGVFTNSFEFPLTATGKTGLKQVRFRICADTDYVRTYLDYIGIYVNNRSITTDYAYVGLHVSDHSYWKFEEFNILSIDVIGNGISIYVENAYYVSQMAPTKLPTLISSAYDYTELKIYNIYDFLFDDYWGYDYIWGGVLWFLFNDTFEFKEILIEGVKMVEGENEYPLEFTHSGVNVIDNYFYVLENKLYFTQTSDDNDIEYIQATFNIENVLTENYSISFNSILTGNAYSHLRIFYTDTTSTLLSLKTYTAGPNTILPQNKIIYSFIILITDNDNDDIEGTTTGYIISIKLIHLTDVSINIITVALLSIMIPLLILIIPTFLIYLRLGRSAIIPTFVLMAFICFITNLIPLWLFFIIIFSCGAFMITKKIISKEVV